MTTSPVLVDPASGGRAGHTPRARELLAGVEKRASCGWRTACGVGQLDSPHRARVRLDGRVARRSGSGNRPDIGVRSLCLPRAQLVRDSLDNPGAQCATARPRYGYYVDHVIDIAGTAMLVAAWPCRSHGVPGRGRHAGRPGSW